MVKTYDYILVLQSNNNKIIDWISQLMLLLSVIAFLFEGIMGIEHQFPTNSIVFWFAFTVFIIAWWVFCFLQAKRNVIPYYRVGLMLAAWGFFTIPGATWLSAVYLIASVLEKFVKIAPEVAFDASEIVFNTWPKHTLNWIEVNNVVLKDGLLTIDLKNNKLIQKMVDADVDAATETEFNHFCSTILTAAQ